MVFPSGEKTGLASTPISMVNRLGLLPFLLATHRSSAYTKAMCDSLIAGWESSLVCCATIGAVKKNTAEIERSSLIDFMRMRFLMRNKRYAVYKDTGFKTSSSVVEIERLLAPI